MGFSDRAGRFQLALLVNEMCRERRFSEITVGDICEAAGISRATFYRMFEDKYALNNWIQAFNFDVGILQIGRTYTWEDGLFIAFSCAEFFGNVASASYEAASAQPNADFARRCVRKCLSDTIENVRHVPLSDDLAFQADFFAAALAARAGEYWQSRSHMGTRAFAERLARCVPAELHDLLDEPLDPALPVTIDASSLARVALTMDDAFFFDA